MTIDSAYREGAMTLTELRYLVAVGDTLHFGRAAEGCHVSQSTLSMQIKKLEDRLGMRVFERTSRIVTLTPLGRRVVDQARVVLAETEKLEQISATGRQILAGPLRLGVIPTLGPYLLPRIAEPLHAAYPDLELVLREDVTAELLVQLGAYELDCLVLALPIAASGLEIQLLFEEPFTLVCPRGHPLARLEKVGEDELIGQRLLLLREGHCLREQALAICRHAFADRDIPGDDFSATSLEMIRQMVISGYGCSLMPSLALAAVDRQLCCVQFKDPVPSRTIGIAWRAMSASRANFQTLARFIRAQLPADGVKAFTDIEACGMKSL